MKRQSVFPSPLTRSSSYRSPFAAQILQLFVLAAIMLPLLPFISPLILRLPYAIGGQSFLLFLLSVRTGLSGNYTSGSRWLTFLFGLLGTIFVTLFLLTSGFCSPLLGRSPFVLVIQEYVTIFFLLGYLALFWWVAYRFVLRPLPPLMRR